ncbi:hypothetical protein EPA93_19065 [Ktedonosporobacter rubrisoli]|uniref:Uncharacterized protein n=1 Tax=Ktedonosporobacter rubrisoli TaxID=2509675 RepID=A0A4V0YYZ9_KTERU|nr:hypothetical protein [Ktedonosporobacter rubrisoli]QBD77981.1 hypothetical protein EPA93_19065 [Ktedonosporobacter rubrisoli]
MNSGPNQPNFYSTPPPYSQGQPGYGQPPYAVPPLPGYAQPKPPRKRRTFLWIFLGIIVVLLLACGGGFFVLSRFISNNPATNTVNAYYDAIKR